MVAESGGESGRAEEKYMSRGEAARRLGVSPRAIQEWAKDGRVPHIRTLGGHRRFSERDLEVMQELVKNRRPRRRIAREAAQ